MSKDDSLVGLTTYVYENNLLVQETQGDRETIYDYDNNGNLTSRLANNTEETIYTWDDENRLVGVETPDGDIISYAYDENNIRVSSTVNGVKTNYVIDANRPYAQVLEEHKEGRLDASYLYGLDLISQQRGGENYFYHVDGLGSTRALSNEGGNLTDTYTYDAYGTLINSSGTTVNSYLFAGEQYDPNLDQYYLRQRYYDPQVGRFTRRDTYEGSLDDPMSQHKYQYAHANPVVNIDPSGYVTVQNVLGGLAIGSVLSGLSFTTGAGVGTLVGGGSLTDAVDLYDQFFAGMTDSLTFGRSTEARRLLYGNEATKNHKGLFFNLGRFGGGFASAWIGGFAGTFNEFGKATWLARAALGYDIYGTGVGIKDVFQKWQEKQKLSFWDLLAFAPLFGWFNVNYAIVPGSKHLASVFGDISIVRRGREGSKVKGTGHKILAEFEVGSSGDFIIEASKPSTKGRLTKSHVYENPGHHTPGHPNFKPNKTVLPDNHVELFLKSVPFKDKNGRTVRYAIDESGDIHQFQSSSDVDLGAPETAFHWAGSTGAKTIRNKKTGLTVPSNVRKRLLRQK